ncbi:tetratricopeptide repeat protein [Spirulina sp. CCNP1310]|uniref:protein kinase domain-containing protein n=1 Tax=Spirulina sp. CCNP1310 TaxID=3110249 RepID=UPI002B1F4FB4|nr:tetratricopeptide repeat protein [Spirulina sp. CCNP1310]MEA5420176.1 tetratricopeptide repeat protein [Spirulina sp. CCNP1310]
MALEGLQGQYRLLELIAEDAFSQTFRGEDFQQSEPQPCWIQRVEGGALSPSYLSTFATLRNLPPDWAIQPLTTVFVENETAYWVYAGASGHYLSQSFDAGEKLTEDQAVQLLKNILPTLGSLHEQGIIHGNLQPQSFFYHQAQNQWCLSHFGAIYQDLPQISQGSIRDLAPIALSGYLPPDTTVPRTVEGDLYSLGVTIIHGVTGILPADLTPQWRNTAPVSERLANLLNLLITQYFSSAPELFEWLTMAAKNSQSQTSQGPQSQVVQPPTTDIVQTEMELEATAKPAGPTYLAHRYRVIRPLSRGGFGETYLAIDEQFPGQPTCIVKKLKLKNYTQKTYEIAKHLFQREAEVLSRLGQHDQIPQLLAHFTQNQEFYLVQEYIEGHDLEVELPLGKKWPEFEVRQLLQELLEILAVIHQEGVIHRDLKPANIRRRDEDGKLVLIDFGAVKQVSKQTSLDGQTKVTVSIGTVGYAPSEQTQGRPKLSSDVYAVGMIALQALTGKDPEHIPEDSQTGELQWRQLVEVSPNFAQFLDRMVRYDFRQRFESAMQALSALQTLDRRVSGPQDAKPVLPVVRRRRPWRQWGFATLGGLALVSLGVWGVRSLLQPSLGQLSGKLQQSLVVVNPDQGEPILGFVVAGEPEYCTVLTTRAAIAQGEAVNIVFRETPPQMVDQVQTLPNSDLVILQQLHNQGSCPHPALPLGNPDRLQLADRVYIQTTTAEVLQSKLTAPLTAVLLTAIETSSLPGVFQLGYQPPATLLVGSAVVNRQGRLLALHMGEGEKAEVAWAMPVTLYQEHLATLGDMTGKSALDRANQLFELRQHDAALVAYDQAIAQESGRPEPWYGRGSTLYALDRYEEAIAAYEQAIALRRDNTLSWYSKGNALFQLKRYEEAIAAYEQAIETKADYFPAINNLGLAQQALGRTDAAIKTFEEVINLRPDYHPAHNNLGATRQRKKDYRGAIAAYDQAIRIRPNYAAAWYNKASAHALQNETAPALEALSRAIALKADLAQSAKENLDFTSLRNNGEFQKLVGDRG